MGRRNSFAHLKNMQVDYDTLVARIRELCKSELPVPTRKVVLNPHLFRFIEEMVRAERVREALTKDHKFGGCDMLEGLEKAKVLGSGALGVVFDVGGGAAVKVEKIRTKDGIRGAEVAKKMGAVGVGPKVQSCKAIECEGVRYVVMKMDKVEGVTLKTWMSKKRPSATVAVVKDVLAKKIAKMKRLGVHHGDLHASNVMVDKKNVPWIIDFNLAQDGDGDDGDGEILRIFDKRVPAADNTVAIVSKLVEEGVIKVIGKYGVRDFLKPHAVWN